MRSPLPRHVYVRWGHSDDGCSCGLSWPCPEKAEIERLRAALALHVRGSGVDRCERCEAPWPCLEAAALDQDPKA